MDGRSPHRFIRRRDRFCTDVLLGLASTPKQLSSKYFYDATGSALFEAICAQPEYYLTRAEFEILDRHGRAIADAIGPRAALVEFGSGSAGKTRRLLHQLHEPVAYRPIEISASALRESVATFADEFPDLDVQPVCGDFTRRVRVQKPAHAQRTALFFPGSTLGNFDRDAACALLRRMRRLIGRDGCAIVGIDLQKDVRTLEAAYNDAAGVTARFTLNLLTRINRELVADFDESRFAHRARYDRRNERIETHIVSLADQVVHVAGRAFAFAKDEAMQVEYSCKYSIDGFAALAADAGLALRSVWTDAQKRFAVVMLERPRMADRVHAARRLVGMATERVQQVGFG